MKSTEEFPDIFMSQSSDRIQAIQTSINIDKPFGVPALNFRLSLSPYFHRVYKKYKTLYPPTPKKLRDLLNGPGLFSHILNNTPPPAFHFNPAEKTIPLEGLVVPDTAEFDKATPIIDDISLLLSFVNITDRKGIMDWISKHGVLKADYSFETPHSQPIDQFVSELYTLKTLYQLFSAVNEYAQYNKEPLISRAKIIKLSDHVKEWDTYEGLLPYEYFWGCNNYSPIKKNKENAEKAKRKPGHILLIDNMLTPSYFETTNITDETLPIKVMEVITEIINHRTKDHYHFAPYAIRPNTNNAPAIFRVIPAIQCNDLLTLIYFQLSWLISSDGQKKCQKCGGYFLPSGQRPGKQKYCGNCGNHAAQDQYKKRTLAAIKAYKSGLSLEQSASENKISIKRLEKALKAGV